MYVFLCFNSKTSQSDKSDETVEKLVDPRFKCVEELRMVEMKGADESLRAIVQRGLWSGAR